MKRNKVQEAMSALGRLGAQQRMRKLSPEQRQAIARLGGLKKAANLRAKLAQETSEGQP